MMREPVSSVVDPIGGGMSGNTGRYEKRLSDLAGLYADQDAHTALLQTLSDPVVYDVEDFKPGTHSGDLIYGVTRMSPGRVGDEFFLTRGHIHAKADRPEIYYGQKGHGLMQLESPEGQTRIIEIRPQTICYVPPYWIHRSINVGDEDLVMVFAYPSDSGQDYGIIEASNGMRHRVVAMPGGGWELVENKAYLPRSAEHARTLIKTYA
ncbi:MULTISPECIES: glucose-6-phosphate isomerase [unclassified Rhizobium]|uniref:glucose-6-phosphate isomerase n=2 Tax=Rhizobium TaxID=379 RepID=UPI001618C173|nr:MULTISPECIES: glucose-6-phosphate isomerase [unclassified Rhizobium]MBB3320000.1 glucose-6-phosphate isomerase [Rhizobium sp. BK181]MBB3545040.1 glucose-6-phosphate isomerase [Rhizobium sp. BK399]MCS3743742.1 glucose-6-phosphate isomerase [Rhizobium sp. BK661]